MNIVRIYRNAVNHEEYDLYENVNDVCGLLKQQLGTFPKTARIYHNVVANINDVTPSDEAGIERLQRLRGTFHVVIYPEGVVLIIAIVAIALAAVAIALTFLLRPHKQGQDEASPNNELGDRQNKARPNERIPWIAGTVRSTPDLLVLPYKFFYQNQEFEYVYSSIGVGHYDILDCKDGVTPVDEIQGEYAVVFGPGTSPNSGAAQATFGQAPPAGVIPPLVSIAQNNAVNGQVVRAPNSGSFTTNNNVAFQYGGNILTNDSNLDFTEYFTASVPGQPTYLTIQNDSDGNASDPNGIYPSVELGGTYQILAVSAGQITLSNPASVNPNWNALANYGGQMSTYYHTFDITSVGDKWVGPFILTNPNMTEVWANLVAQNGLYYIDNKGRQGALHVTVLMEVTAIDENYNPIGDSITATGNIDGSGLTKNLVGCTIRCGLPSAGAVQVRIKLLTPMQTDTRNSYSQEIQWRDLYAVSPVTASDFGDITTVMAITAQTQDALSVKERKLNLLVTRKLPTWINRSASGAPQMSTALYATNNAADIIVAMALDPTIGRRSIAELDIPGIYAVADSAHLNDPAGLVNSNEHIDGEIVTYFGTFLMSEFNYTFDDSKVSFEESIADVAHAINCTAYRQGSTISLLFEKLTNDSSLLFNHRNKLPGSETRTVSFGPVNDNDGIEYTYVDPNAPNYPGVDSNVTLFFPPDQSATNPKKVQSVGVRNPVQAEINGWRMYQKLINANCQTEFTATQEATELVLTERILVADNTRYDTQDGEVLGQDGLTILTSQPLTFETTSTYTVFLQLSDGTVQSIAATPGLSSNVMLLAVAPNLPLVVSNDTWAKTTYMLVDNNAASTTKRGMAFLLTKKDPQDNGTFKLTAINYTDLYYLHDQDVNTNVISVPASGYTKAGYTGSGLLTSTGSTYIPPARTPFSLSSYTGSALDTANNVTTQYTTPPPGSGTDITLNVNGTGLSALTDLDDAPASGTSRPAGTLQVKFQLSGTDEKQIASAYVQLPNNGGKLTGGVLVGSDTHYTLPTAPNSVNDIRAYRNGQRLYPTDDFTVTTTTLAILGVDTTGDVIFIDSYAV